MSQSIDQGFASAAKGKAGDGGIGGTAATGGAYSRAAGAKDTASSDDPGTKTMPIQNRPFDEALEISHSGSESSFESQGSDKKTSKPPTRLQQSQNPSANTGAKPAAPQMFPSQSVGGLERPVAQSQFAPQQQKLPGNATANPAGASKTSGVIKDVESGDESEGSGDDNEGEGDESYENLENAYNPSAFKNLNVTADVKDLFQYIERYKPHEVELETTLKCFIPEFIPAIGEMDGFIKVPRPDKKDDDLGLKYLDEPAAMQSDPTVLELQLRAKSKKQQYGDVAVRSIDNASKNPAAIEKWIQSIR